MSLTARQQQILDSYERHDTADISTERLLAMVEDDTGADAGELIDALQALGEEARP